MPEAVAEKRAYGCLFCVTGKETACAQQIERELCDSRAIVARQLKRKTVAGKTNTGETVLFPGYVFVEAPAHIEKIPSIKSANIISILTYGTGDWRLYGDDARFVRWLFSCDGLVSFSKAYQEGERIRIISGPLKDLDGQILRIDKRNRNGQVAISFCNRVIKMWLGFELVEKI